MKIRSQMFVDAITTKLPRVVIPTTNTNPDKA